MLVVVAAAVVALSAWGAPRQPKFVVTATPTRAPTHGATRIPWFHLVVRNVGNAGGFVTGCVVEGRDDEGKPLPKLQLVSVPMPDRDGPDGSTTVMGGVYIPAGGTFTYDYLVLGAGADASQVPHQYSAWCRLAQPDDVL